MFSTRSQFARFLAALAVATFLLVAAVGLPHFSMTMSMDMDEHGNMTMTDCYMPGMTTLCNMSPLEHIASWQNMFVSTVAQNFELVLSLLALFAIAGLLWVKREHSPPQGLRKFSRVLHEREYIPLLSPLQELFSNGILNPKLF